MGARGPRRRATVFMSDYRTAIAAVPTATKAEVDPWAGSLTELSREFSYEVTYRDDLGTYKIAGFESLGIASHFGLTMQASEKDEPREVVLFCREAAQYFMPDPRGPGWIKHDKRAKGRK